MLARCKFRPAESPYPCHAKAWAGIFRDYLTIHMTKKIDPRSATKKAKDAIYAALPVALIIKPLQFIKAESAYIAHDTKGRPYTAYGVAYQNAIKDAKHGHGGHVQARPRQFLVA